MRNTPSELVQVHLPAFQVRKVSGMNGIMKRTACSRINHPNLNQDHNWPHKSCHASLLLLTLMWKHSEARYLGYTGVPPRLMASELTQLYEQLKKNWRSPLVILQIEHIWKMTRIWPCKFITCCNNYIALTCRFFSDWRFQQELVFGAVLNLADKWVNTKDHQWNFINVDLQDIRAFLHFYHHFGQASELQNLWWLKKLKIPGNLSIGKWRSIQVSSSHVWF